MYLTAKPWNSGGWLRPAYFLIDSFNKFYGETLSLYQTFLLFLYKQGINVNEEFKLLAQKLSQRSRASTSRTSFRYNVNRTEDMRTDFDACGQDTDPMDVIHVRK